MRLGRGVFTIGEDTHTLRLKSELFDLRVGYANPRAFWANGFQDRLVVTASIFLRIKL